MNDDLLKTRGELFLKKDKDLSTLTTQHSKDLEAAIIQANVEALSIDSLQKIRDEAIEAYKSSEEFGGLGMEYFERGLKTACRWVTTKFTEVVSSILSELESPDMDYLLWPMLWNTLRLCRQPRPMK